MLKTLVVALADLIKSKITWAGIMEIWDRGWRIVKRCSLFWKGVLTSLVFLFFAIITIIGIVYASHRRPPDPPPPVKSIPGSLLYHGATLDTFNYVTVSDETVLPASAYSDFNTYHLTIIKNMLFRCDKALKARGF